MAKGGDHPFFPVSLQLAGRRCIVIGEAGDREAIEKAGALRESGADVHWIRNAAELRDEDVIGAFFVVSTPQDEALSKRLRALADEYRFLLCCIDQPKYGFVAMTAVAKAGPVRVTIATSGLAPRVGKILKERLQSAMDGRFARFVMRLGEKKLAMQREQPGAEQSAARRAAMIEAAEGFDAAVSFAYPAWFDAEDAARR
jgi:siroheme synthase (precorrin-2 oxidase/ferrochelatase)